MRATLKPTAAVFAALASIRWTGAAFSFSPRSVSVSALRSGSSASLSLSSSSSSSSSSDIAAESPASSGGRPTMFTTAFDFSSREAVDRFERIDDAIMGGVSTSALRLVEGSDFASWRGVCRTDGGGFCGMRTAPLREALNVDGQDGIFVDCRLASDDEPDRRVWKMSLRTDSSRGEMVYQSEYRMPRPSGDGTFGRVMIPFDRFVQVRGPRVMPDAPPLNATAGIFQVGMALSKFMINANTTTMENFRDGFFDLNIRRIGFYSDDKHKQKHADENENQNQNETYRESGVISVQTLSKEEAQRNKPILLKLLLPLSKMFFSEKSNRRKVAMNKLRNKRDMSRVGAIVWAIRWKAASSGIARALVTTAATLTVDCLRLAFGKTLKLCLFYPFVLISRTVKFIKKNIFRMNTKELPSMTE